MAEPELLSSVEIETGDNPSASIIWLHGLGADGHDFESLVPHLSLGDRAVRFIFPHAPMMPVTINMGMTMRAWYDVVTLDLDRKEDEEGVRRSASQIEHLLAREKERGIPAGSIILAGFSQGGAIAYHAGLRHTETLAGLLVMSSYLPLAWTVADEASPENRSTPILHCHGSFDPMVPVGLGERTVEQLEGQGYVVEWKTYPAEHSIHPQEVADVGVWLSARLD